MKRAMKSFEADKDVDRMLVRAVDKDGIKLVHICNRALRKYLREQGYARKKDLNPQQ
jgi:hypothetical protein